MVRAPWGPSHTLRIQDGYHPRWPSGHKLVRRVRNGPKSDVFGPVSDTRAKLDFAAIWHSTGNMAEIHEQKLRSIFAKSKLEMSKFCVEFLQSPSWKSNLRWICAKSKLEILGVGALVRRPSIGHAPSGASA